MPDEDMIAVVKAQQEAAAEADTEPPLTHPSDDESNDEPAPLRQDMQLEPGDGTTLEPLDTNTTPEVVNTDPNDPRIVRRNVRVLAETAAAQPTPSEKAAPIQETEQPQSSVVLGTGPDLFQVEKVE